MAQLLSKASALNPGHELWVSPDDLNSKWSQRLDWYLNFQIAKARAHRAATRQAPLEEILNEIEWTPETFAVAANEPLLISCAGLLTSRWVALVPQADDLTAWIQKVERLWRGLGRPPLRVFLPTGLQAGTFSEEWKRHVGTDDLSVVLD